MRGDLQRGVFNSSLVHAFFDHEDLQDYGKWSFLSTTAEDSSLSCGMWHRTHPLRKFLSSHTSLIIDLFEKRLRDWLDPHSAAPVAVPEAYKPLNPQVLAVDLACSVQEREIEQLKTLFRYAEFIGGKHGKLCERKAQCHLRWTSDSLRHEYPEPDLRPICSESAINPYRKAFILIMRYPGPFDGGVDYMLERCLWPVITLLFGGPSARLFPLGASTQLCERDSPPLIVAYESAELNDSIRMDMAKAIHPTLLALLQRYRGLNPTTSLLPHCFVYGLHLSPTHLSIFVHFPRFVTSPEGTEHWEFCQVRAAKFLISLEEEVTNTHEDMFLYRWRLVIALFTIVRHVRLLEQELTAMGACDDPSPSLSCLDPQSVNWPSSRHKSFLTNRTLLTDLSRLSAVWRRPQLVVPAEWMHVNNMSTEIDRFSRVRDMAAYLPHKLGTLAFHHICKYLSPICKEDVKRIHLVCDEADPDFMHPVHAPRSRFGRKSIECIDPDVNTLPHFYRAVDFLNMSTQVWDDVNIFIANVLAGFSMYRVPWKPSIRYPFHVPDVYPERCICDFALAVEAIPPTTKATMKRAPSLPLTLTSPALLLGLRSTHWGDARVVSDEELVALSQTMEPHLKLFRLLREHEEDIILLDGVRATAEPTLFCTYLKTGFLHILAFTYGDERSSCVSNYLIDSLPLGLHCQTDEDLFDRMRIVIALFTLQREVVKVSEAWSRVCWPLDLLVDEHEAIVEVTGQNSPSPSEAYVDRTPEWAWHDAYDDGLEDDEEFIKQGVARSVAIVSSWLSQLEPIGSEYLDSGEREPPISADQE